MTKLAELTAVRNNLRITDTVYKFILILGYNFSHGIFFNCAEKDYTLTYAEDDITVCREVITERGKDF